MYIAVYTYIIDLYLYIYVYISIILVAKQTPIANVIEQICGILFINYIYILHIGIRKTHNTCHKHDLWAGLYDSSYMSHINTQRQTNRALLQCQCF